MELIVHAQNSSRECILHHTCTRLYFHQSNKSNKYSNMYISIIPVMPTPSKVCKHGRSLKISKLFQQTNVFKLSCEQSTRMILLSVFAVHYRDQTTVVCLWRVSVQVTANSQSPTVHTWFIQSTRAQLCDRHIH